jgi:hypothetical protein
MPCAFASDNPTPATKNESKRRMPTHGGSTIVEEDDAAGADGCILFRHFNSRTSHLALRPKLKIGDGGAFEKWIGFN